MSDNPWASIEECFGDIHDPHVRGRCDYPLTRASARTMTHRISACCATWL